MILVDTCVLIDYLKEEPGVSEIIKNIGKDDIALNSIVIMELISGARDKIELNSTKRRLNNFQITPDPPARVSQDHRFNT